MKPVTLTASLLTAALALTACSQDEEEGQDGPVGSPVPIDEQGGLDTSADEDEESDESETEAQQEEAEADESPSGAPETSEAEAEDEDASPQDSEQEEAVFPQDSEEAYQWAIEDSEQLDSEEDYSEYARGDREFDDPDEFAEYIESHHVIMERAAEVMTGFRAGDWNKDVAIVRANYLLTDGAQQPGIPERPQSGDPAWEPAMECNADTEVRTQVLDGPNEDSHSPYTEIAAEYRWITDQDCDVPDPDHFYVYSMTTGDDALVTDFSREQVSYEEDNPGMFD